METEVVSFTDVPALAYELAERGEAKIKAAQEAEELAVAERDRQWEAERATAIAEFVAAAQGEVPPELAEFVFATDEFSRNHTANEAALRVPGFGEIEFQMSRIDGKWTRSTYNPKFRAWAYGLSEIHDDYPTYHYAVSPAHNDSAWTVDLEIALAHAYRFGQERERLQAEAAAKNADLQERAGEQAEYNARQREMAEADEALAPEPTAGEILLDAIQNFVREAVQ